MSMKKMILGMLLCFSLAAAEETFSGKIILLDQNASDLVYQLPLKNYTKWLCEAESKNKKKIQFVSVKAMMQVYQHEPYFIKRKLLETGIKAIYVQDYLTGKRIDAKRAVYLFGSRTVGPHGDDLIPFASEESAKLFMMKNGGTKILPYTRITKGLIRYLDM
jgi:nitrous oxide reductase accessory protein NosL